MKAVVVHQYGGPEVLKFEEYPDPVPGQGEVLAFDDSDLGCRCRQERIAEFGKAACRSKIRAHEHGFDHCAESSESNFGSQHARGEIEFIGERFTTIRFEKL